MSLLLFSIILTTITIINSKSEHVTLKIIKGEKGDTGIPGAPGIPGKPGLPGKSIPGPPGINAIGNTGITGPKGLQGITGLKGDRGIKGEKGDKGNPGICQPYQCQYPKKIRYNNKHIYSIDNDSYYRRLLINTNINKINVIFACFITSLISVLIGLIIVKFCLKYYGYEIKKIENI